MSPVEPPAPERAGSVRQPACFGPVSSTGVASQSWAYSTCTTRIWPSRPVGDHGARLPDHRVAGVVVGEHEERVRLGRRLLQPLRLGERRGQRLVADHVDAALEELARGRGVHVVGRDDRDRLDAVLPPRLALGHGREVVVDPVGREPERRARGARLLRRRGEGAGDQLVFVVDPRRDAVHRADEGVLAAADHARAGCGPACRRSLSFLPSVLSSSSPRGSPARRPRPRPGRCRRAAARPWSPPRGPAAPGRRPRR